MTISAALAAAIAGGALLLPSEPECAPGEVTMSVHAIALDDGTCERVTVQGECGTDLAIPVDAETVRPIPCDGVPRTIPLAEAYPECIVGDVSHPERTYDGPGICCEPGCTCAGTCRHIAPGGPAGYDVAQLAKMTGD